MPGTCDLPPGVQGTERSSWLPQCLVSGLRPLGRGCVSVFLQPPSPGSPSVSWGTAPLVHVLIMVFAYGGIAAWGALLGAWLPRTQEDSRAECSLMAAETLNYLDLHEETVTLQGAAGTFCPPAVSVCFPSA